MGQGADRRRDGSAQGAGLLPRLLAMDTAGYLFVADQDASGSDRIQQRDAQGNWSVLATGGAGLGQVLNPTALATPIWSTASPSHPTARRSGPAAATGPSGCGARRVESSGGCSAPPTWGRCWRWPSPPTTSSWRRAEKRNRSASSISRPGAPSASSRDRPRLSSPSLSRRTLRCSPPLAAIKSSASGA